MTLLDKCPCCEELGLVIAKVDGKNKRTCNTVSCRVDWYYDATDPNKEIDDAD